MSIKTVQLRKSLETREENITLIDSLVCSPSLGATHKLTLGESVVKASANTASDNFTLYLPDVAEAAGMLFSIEVIIADGKTVTLADNDESLDWTDVVLDTDGDGILHYSDGRKWWILTGYTMGLVDNTSFTVSTGPLVTADLDKEIFIAPAACTLDKVVEVHSVVCDASDTIQIEKLTTGEDSGAGDDLLPSAYTLNSTKDTPISKTIVAGARTLAAGDRIAPYYATGDGTSWKGSLTLLMSWV